jgi:hypothetical protein
MDACIAQPPRTLNRSSGHPDTGDWWNTRLPQRTTAFISPFLLARTLLVPKETTPHVALDRFQSLPTHDPQVCSALVGGDGLSLCWEDDSKTLQSSIYLRSEVRVLGADVSAFYRMRMPTRQAKETQPPCRSNPPPPRPCPPAAAAASAVLLLMHAFTFHRDFLPAGKLGPASCLLPTPRAPPLPRTSPALLVLRRPIGAASVWPAGGAPWAGASPLLATPVPPCLLCIPGTAASARGHNAGPPATSQPKGSDSTPAPLLRAPPAAPRPAVQPARGRAEHIRGRLGRQQPAPVVPGPRRRAAARVSGPRFSRERRGEGRWERGRAPRMLASQESRPPQPRACCGTPAYRAGS